METPSKAAPSIFWADDDADDLELFREVLRKLAPGHLLIEFEHGKALLEHLERLPQNQHPCLIVLDMNMPVLNGRDTLTTIKSQDRFDGIPVVVFTTSNSPLDQTFCKRHHTEMITKPPSYGQLKKVVQNLLSFCH